MKNMLIASGLLACRLLLFAACQNNTPHPTPSTASAAMQYACPMNCEPGKTYDHPGTCPVCNMALEVVQADAAPKAEYFADLKITPATLELGKSATLDFTPKMRGNESALVPLDLVHEKKMHLILVNDDLTWFDHLHPQYQPNGAYRITAIGQNDQFANGRGQQETRFESGGKFWAFADYKPTSGLNTVDKMELNVTGSTSRPTVFSNEKRSVVTDGYTVALGSQVLAAGQAAQIPVSIHQGGQAVDAGKLENYLGEKAHLILVETTTKEFLHTHPGLQDGQLVIRTTFAKPGTYRGWLQFQTDGKVHTADFVLKVAEGSAGSGAAAGHSGY
jgi:hypothetical protein